METINLRQLQEVINATFNHVIEDLGKTEINLNESLYWVIDKEARYNPMQDPEMSKLSLGDLYEDLKSIERLALDKDPSPCTINFSFIAPILQYLYESDEWYEND